jgi:hypothetical protein
MNEQPGHYFSADNTKPYCKQISRGVCECGAVKFFSVTGSKESIELVKYYNGKKGKEGQGHMVQISDARKKTENSEAQNPAAPPDVKAQGAVPPRPNVAGLTKGKSMHLMHKYYLDNKAAIIADFQKLGEEAMLQRWGIGQGTWIILRARFMPDKFQLPNWKRLKKKDVAPKTGEKPAAAASQPPKPEAETKLEAETEETETTEGLKHEVKKEPLSEARIKEIDEAFNREYGLTGKIAFPNRLITPPNLLSRFKAWLPKRHGMTSPGPYISLGTFTVTVGEDDGLPAFPAFDADISNEVRVAWLKAYVDLKKLEAFERRPLYKKEGWLRRKFGRR